MSEPISDIDALLTVLAKFGWERHHATAKALVKERNAAIKQRDEARRRVCELSLIKKLVYRKLDGVDGRFIECKTPEEIAQVYEWDCFKDEGGAFVFCSNCDYAISRQQMLDLASRLCPRCNRAAISEFYSIGSFTHIERRKAWIRGEIKGCPPSLPDRMPNEGGGA